MDIVAKRRFIENELLKRVKVLVEYDGYQSDEANLKEMFDTFFEEGFLSLLKDIEEKLDGIARSSGIEDVQASLEEIKKIKESIGEYAKELAKNAEFGKVDVSKVSSDHYDKLARIFEKKHKEKLRVVSPSFWV